MGVLLERWRSAKRLFKTTAKVKKPSPAVEGVFATKGLGIEKALKKLEAAEDKGINQNAKALADWQKAELEYGIAMGNYLVVLNSSLGQVPAGADKAAYVKGIAVLKTQLIGLQKTVKVYTKTAVESHRKANATAMMANSLIEQVESGVHNAYAFIARIRAQPNAADFNAGIQKYSRDITQNIGNINKLKAKGHQINKAQPDKLLAVLSAWSNHGRQVAPNATPAQVERELKIFEKAVKAVEAWLA